ncbi:N-6 DNA methylase [Providencia rettgeri]|uniref:N-6 DNA methylase n=1 Tax=Providencia rettgeri TaxID=587 RepID=UPI0030165ADB
MNASETGRDFHREFVRLFDETARYHNRARVFDDFIHCAAIALHNGIPCQYSGTLEQRYLEIIRGYEQADTGRLARLLALTVEALTAEPHDFLGRVFMALNMGDAHRGQFFTPWHVTQLMAQLSCADLVAQLQTKPYVTACEPCCGAGGMTIAIAGRVKQAGFSPAHHLWVSCTDIDAVARCMAYVQLSLLGIAGEVVLGNVLADERREVWYTPAHYLGNWSFRLNPLR